MIKAIIFDVGDTITNGNWRKRALAIEKETGVAIRFEDTNIKEAKELAYLGKLPFRKVLALFSKTGERQDVQRIFDSYQRNFIKYSIIRKDVVSLVMKLRKDYKIYALSNTNDLHERINRKRGLFKIFHKTFLSNRLGIKKSKKSGKKLFLYVLKNIRLRPQEVIFIDDLSGNVEIASSLGIKSILFKNYKNLVIELRKLGVIQ